MNLIVIVMMMWSCSVLLSQETWKKTFGGTANEMGESITTTSDGGLVLTGSNASNNGDFKGMNKSSSRAIFVIKLDSLGNVLWKKTYGGSGNDYGYSIITTPDSGLVLTGSYASDDGDFEGMKKGYNDIFVIKLNSRGDIQWKKTFGGSIAGTGLSITTTPDGGLVLTGSNASDDGDFEGMFKDSNGSNGSNDIFVIKLDSRGDVQWKKTFGGSEDDVGYSIITTPDSGLVLTGRTSSNDVDFEGMNKGAYDIFVIKLDSRGDVQWKKTFGGSVVDDCYSITTTPDGGLVLTGGTSSNDGDFNGINKGEVDIFVIKLDSRGDVQWKKTYGGSGSDRGNSITTTPDGGLVLTGLNRSNDGDFQGMNKAADGNMFVIKLDSRGEVQWKKTFGGSVYDPGLSITTTPDGGLVLTGSNTSDDGDFKGMNKGGYDIFVIKLDSNGNLNPPTSIDVQSDILSSFDITPNPLSSFSTISYSLDKPSHVRIEVVNSIGEVVFVLSDKQEDVGSQQVSFNTTDLVTGTYSIRLIENNRVTSKRVIQMK